MDGKYDMACSGHLEKSESMATAVVREAREEIGIEINEKEKCDNLQWFDIDKLPENMIIRNRKVIENMELGIMYDDDNFTNQKLQKKKEINNEIKNIRNTITI